jgi:phosphoglycerol transferase MdoB-like AlkP superfamily enzyme
MASSSRGARGLIGVGLLWVLGLAAWYGRTVWVDSGPFVFVLFGIPVVCATVALWAERRSRTMLAPAVVAALAVVSLTWALLTALGIGLVLVPPSVLLLLAAVVSWLHRTGRDTAASSRT